jgi:phage shock protein A
MDTYNQYSQAQKSLIEAKAKISYAQTIAHKDYFNAVTQLEKWMKRYKLAIKDDNKDLISQAKFQVEKYEAIARRLATLCDEQMPYMEKIGERLQVLNDKAKNNNLLNEINTIQENAIPNDYLNLDQELQSLKDSLNIQVSEGEKLEYNLQTSNPEFTSIIDDAIAETKKTIQKAIEWCRDRENHCKKVKNRAERLHLESLEHLENQDDDLAIQKIIMRKVRNEVVDVVASDIRKKREMIELLQKNLKTLEKVKSMLFAATPNFEYDESVDSELELLRKELEGM